MTMPIQLTLYSTSHCHLCEQAEALLANLALTHDLSWSVVDIADDTTLQSRFELKIPVLQRLDNAQLLCWPFNHALLLDFLKPD